jgi:hypothetical protein
MSHRNIQIWRSLGKEKNQAYITHTHIDAGKEVMKMLVMNLVFAALHGGLAAAYLALAIAHLAA